MVVGYRRMFLSNGPASSSRFGACSVPAPPTEDNTYSSDYRYSVAFPGGAAVSYLDDLPVSFEKLSKIFFSGSSDIDARRRLARLFCSIAECVERIAVNLRAGLHSPSECAELNTYIHQIENLVSQHVEAGDCRKLVYALTWVDEVPGWYEINVEREVEHASQPGWVATRWKRARRVSEIAGTIRALGNLGQV
jgi:hypothetical protein